MVEGWSTWCMRRSWVSSLQARAYCPPPLPTILRLSWELYFYLLMRLFSPFYLSFPFQVFFWCLAELCLSTSKARHPLGSNIPNEAKQLPTIAQPWGSCIKQSSGQRAPLALWTPQETPPCRRAQEEDNKGRGMFRARSGQVFSPGAQQEG